MSDEDVGQQCVIAVTPRRVAAARLRLTLDNRVEQKSAAWVWQLANADPSLPPYEPPRVPPVRVIEARERWAGRVAGAAAGVAVALVLVAAAAETVARLYAYGLTP